MNIIGKGHRLLGAMLLAICLLFSPKTDAHGHGGSWHGGGWHHGGGWGGVYLGEPNFYYGGYPTCGWIRGHWRHDHWIPAHRICWY